VNQDNYASSFSYQWRKFKQTQLVGDQKQITKIRLYETAKWPDNLKDQLILEAGCGVGRFTEIVLLAQARVYSFDLGASVELAMDNLKGTPWIVNYHPFQADIYEIPLPYAMFDKILCLGVLQHCPDVKKAYLSLVSFLKPGGELVIDCYLRQPLRDMFNLKYLIRPFFKWWRLLWLFAFCTIAISVAYDTKSFLTKVPIIGGILSKLIPIGKLNYEPDYHFSVSEIKEIKTLSMFDMLSPRYDNPQRLSDLRAWIEGAGLEIAELTTGYNGINARARKKSENPA
jgi:SAM-dependent methyltransferase